MLRANVGSDVLVKTTTDKLLRGLSDNRKKICGNQSALFQLVDEIDLPHFDFSLMSRLMLGKHWKSVTDAQQEQFVT